MDYGFTSQFLALTGYLVLEKESLAAALLEIRPHERHRSVFRCCVFGSKNAGKTSFIRGLIGKDQVTIDQYMRRGTHNRLVHGVKNTP